MGPTGTNTAGTSAEAAAIICAGIVLSQPPMRTTESIGWARSISSVSIAIRLRRNMLVGYANDSCSEIVGNSIGRPPASMTPRLIASTSLGTLPWQALKSLKVLAMPTTGRESASSDRPIALMKALRRKSENSASPYDVSPFRMPRVIAPPCRRPGGALSRGRRGAARRGSRLRLLWPQPPLALQQVRHEIEADQNDDGNTEKPTQHVLAHDCSPDDEREASSVGRPPVRPRRRIAAPAVGPTPVAGEESAARPRAAVSFPTPARAPAPSGSRASARATPARRRRDRRPRCLPSAP